MRTETGLWIAIVVLLGALAMFQSGCAGYKVRWHGPCEPGYKPVAHGLCRDVERL